MFHPSGSRFSIGCLTVLLISVGSAAQQPGSLPASTFRAFSTPASSTNSSPSRAVVPTTGPPLTVEMRGDIYMARKMFREAIDMYRTGPADSPVLANKIGIAFHQLQQFDLAKRNYERAIKLNPKYPDAINNLGTIYYSAKSYRRAIGYYKKAIRYSPPSASIDANLGSAYFARHDYKHATEWYEKALAIDPEVFERHSHYGTLMQERTISERAMFHLYLAKTYAKAGEKERALNYLRKALEEGVKDRNKIPDMPEFASLKTAPEFQELLAENIKPL